MSAEPSSIETAIREQLIQVLDWSVTPELLEPDASLTDVYGLTSLSKIVFMMSACDVTGVSLAAFTEPDIAAMRTLRDVVSALARARKAAT